MKKILFYSCLILSLNGISQNMSDFEGNWTGEIPNSQAFNLRIEIENFGNEKAILKLSNPKEILSFPFKAESSRFFKIQFTEDQYLEGQLNEDATVIHAFIKSGILFYHIDLHQTKTNTYKGVWNILMLDELKSSSIYLSVENAEGENFQAYPFFRDNRFTGTWCGNFQKEKDEIKFMDFKTGLRFKGKLSKDKIRLGLSLGEFYLTQIELKKSSEEWVFGSLKPEDIRWTNSLKLLALEKAILDNTLENTHSVLVSRKGEVIYENYFKGFNENISHDLRSASKSISSTIVGLAIDQGHLKNVDQTLFEFIPSSYQQHNNGLKSQIDIKSLLTMSSGLDADDYAPSGNSQASEGQYQNSANWLETVLKAKMVNPPNVEANYGSANPFLLGLILDSVLEEQLELYMDKMLFQKLGISNYIIQSDLEGKPYFGGGIYMTGRDMIKFGELYLLDGQYKKEKVLSKEWVQSSFANYRKLENVPEKNGYGYLWWHHSYKASEKIYKSIEARGNGGQYIFIIPDLDLVVAITSANFRNGKTQQPELILEKYILPYLVD